jgi:hypothetical protein
LSLEACGGGVSLLELAEPGELDPFGSPANNRDRARPLCGPYRVPRPRKGDRATCLFKDCGVAVTGWADARTSWPRYRPVGVPPSRGGPQPTSATPHKGGGSPEKA